MVVQDGLNQLYSFALRYFLCFQHDKVEFVSYTSHFIFCLLLKSSNQRMMYNAVWNNNSKVPKSHREAKGNSWKFAL